MFGSEYLYWQHGSNNFLVALYIFCLLIFMLCYFKIVFCQTFAKPLYSPPPDFYNFRSLPGGISTFTPMFFDHWMLVADEWRRTVCDVFWNGSYMMRQFYRYVNTDLFYSMLCSTITLVIALANCAIAATISCNIWHISIRLSNLIPKTFLAVLK